MISILIVAYQVIRFSVVQEPALVKITMAEVQPRELFAYRNFLIASARKSGNKAITL